MISLSKRREGRMGNQLIVYLVCFLISKKFKKKINIATYLYKEDINKLGIVFEKYCEIESNNIFQEENHRGKCINDDEMVHVLNDYKELSDDIWLHWWCWCQQPDTIKCIVDYFYNKENELPRDIITNNKYKIRYNNNKDIFIHMRLNGLLPSTKSKLTTLPVLNYYIICISMIKKKNIDNIYITTDHKYDKTYLELLEWCNKSNFNTIIYEENHTDTILFGSTCKNIILSSGSYSFIIGLFGFMSNIYIYEYAGRGWHPEYYCSLNHLPNVKMLTDKDIITI